MKIGIMGGTFNPTHTGHLVIAEEARYSFHLDKVIFIPNHIPPHKPHLGEVAVPDDRFRMVRLATENHPDFDASDMELKRQGRSYSIDTVKALRSSFGKEARLFFIVGSDSIYEISIWKDVGELIDLCTFIVVVRSGYSLEKLDAHWVKLEEKVFNRLVENVLHIPVIGISSTEIRERIKQGRTIRYLVPEAVENYIKEKGLYGYKEKNDFP